MPIAEGGNLSDAERLSLYKGSVNSILQVATQIANALDVAHEAGVIHRDIKPQNILFTGRGHSVWVSDFGICLISGARRMTDLGEIVGPQWFMAPELERGGHLDVTPAADVYSLGKLIFYMFSGGSVVPRETVLDEQNDSLFVGGWSQRLRLLMARMVAPLETRLKTMKEVKQGLQAVADWERDAQLLPMGPSAIAGIEELRRRSQRAVQIEAENESARDQERRTLAAVKAEFKSWALAELEVASSRIGDGQNIRCAAGEISETGSQFRTAAFAGNTQFTPLVGAELRLHIAPNLKRVERLQLHLCQARKIATRVIIKVGRAEQEPVAIPAQDFELAMVPIYGQGVIGKNLLSGFLTKKELIGTRRGQLVPNRPGIRGPSLQSYVMESVTKTMHPQLSQCVRFRASEWLNVGEELRDGLIEAIDVFVEFVLSGATNIGA